MSGPGAYITEHGHGDALPTHRHRGGYASLVLQGSYSEVSADGPVACAPGTLLLHPVFHAHGNRFGSRGARVVNLALPDGLAPEGTVAFQVHDLRKARRALEAGIDRLSCLVHESQPAPRIATQDWQAAFVTALADGDISIAAIARRCGVTPAHASRAIGASHGMSPQQLRRELRWRLALRMLRGDESLASVATLSGFADQSHFNRTTRATTGLTPAHLRVQVKSVQDDMPTRPDHPGTSAAADPRRLSKDSPRCPTYPACSSS